VQKPKSFWEELSDVPKTELYGIILAFVVLFGFHLGPALPGLKAQGQTILGIFLWFMIIMIVSESNKFAMGVATPMLLVVLGKMKIPEAYSAFSSDAFFLAIGAFAYAAVMMATPLGKRIALVITDLFRSVKVPRIAGGLALADVGISGFLPTVAETAVFLPLARGINELMKGKEELDEVKRIKNCIYLLICGIMPLFTAMMTLTSHFPNIIMAGYLKDMKGIYISWMDWLVLNLPLWGLIPVAFIYTVSYFKLWKAEIPGASEEIPKMKQELGKITWPEKWALLCLAIALILWMTEGKLHNFSTGMTAIILVGLLFLPWGKLEFNKIYPHMMWDVWVLLGGAISLGTALHKSGVVDWMVKLMLEPLGSAIYGLPPIIILTLVVFISHIPRAGIVSAAAMGAMFIPMTIGLADKLGFNALPFTLIVINCLSYSFFLPMSITAFFIGWGASGMSMGEAIKFGTPLTIISNIYCIVVMSIWLPLLGYPLMM
jgi:anion transporter